MIQTILWFIYVLVLPFLFSRFLPFVFLLVHVELLLSLSALAQHSDCMTDIFNVLSFLSTTIDMRALPAEGQN